MNAQVNQNFQHLIRYRVQYWFSDLPEMYYKNSAIGPDYSYFVSDANGQYEMR